MMRRIKTELAPFVRWAFGRDGIPYREVEVGTDGGSRYQLFKADIPSNRFSSVIEDAKAEKEYRERGIPGIPVLSYKAALNPVRMDALLCSYGSDCFTVRAADAIKYRRLVDLM